MKRILVLIVVLLVISFIFCSCGCEYNDEYRDSLDGYREWIEKYGQGFSEVELDDPNYFLPSTTFLSDFEYEDGGYYYYSQDILRMSIEDKRDSETVLLYLKYSKEEYQQAKDFTLEKLPIPQEHIFEYGNYIFYENVKYLELHSVGMLDLFTMVCYNDEKCTLIFLGYEDGYPGLSEQEKENYKKDWKSFIDTYFGKYYDFGAQENTTEN